MICSETVSVPLQVPACRPLPTALHPLRQLQENAQVSRIFCLIWHEKTCVSHMQKQRRRSAARGNRAADLRLFSLHT